MDTGITLNDTVLDLVAIFEEASDSGRLVGSENTIIETASTDAQINRRDNHITLTLSDGSCVHLSISVAVSA